MSILKILTFPDDRLRIIAKKIEKITPEVQTLIDDMIETMHSQRGVGLAATQVNYHKRVIVIDISEKYNNPITLINPKILEKRGKSNIEEGCLSIPNVYSSVSRATEIIVEALDRDSKKLTFEAHGLLAICVQHELDHLEGKLFIDYLSPLKRKRIRDKLTKIKRYNERQLK
ncbi:peptide deformylase 1 [Candidatus Photodesmus blepharus]|uniref:Peptide deformylase n=1 Tax=Candidatus Photodesmus blepharonis TaxID=1179155 RepID=A0A084CN86_9GAMM|nr:peptide deformylase [Candidatus Photodesmus blepharus]KEY91265.1 peptide deformylase 1 [Candidatus Photodesmus blepharus]